MTDDGGVKPETEGWMRLVADYRIGAYRGEEVVVARLHPGLDSTHPEVARQLDGWSGQSYVHQDGDGTEIVLVRSVAPPEPYRWGLHGLLLLLTLFTTLMAGSLLLGRDPLSTHVATVWGVTLPYPTGVDWERLWLGRWFALPFLGILLVHEAGHYLAARWHRIRVTLPFFLPFPAYWSIVGSLGAFIRIKGPTVRRPILFDVGVAGPVASFVVSIPVLAWGLSMSTVGYGDADLTTPFVIGFATSPTFIGIGNGAVVHLLAQHWFGDVLGDLPILLHPVALAGWIGLFLTSLNLIPLGQLDGGHVLYALLGEDLQVRAARLFLLALVPLGFLWWGWWFWGGVALLVNRFRLRHPPVLQPGVDLGRGRRLLAWAAILAFFLTLVPVPVIL